MDARSETTIHPPHIPSRPADELTPSAQELISADYFDEAALRRIRACVTACEGISTAELEGGVIQEMQRALVRVVPLLEEAQRVRARNTSAGVSEAAGE